MTMPSEESIGLLRAFLLNGEGGGAALGWEQVREWTPQDGSLWVHLDTEDDTAEAWLRERSGLDGVVCDALLANETRPQSRTIGDGLLVILRGVNLNPGADPKDMVSLRLWGDSTRMVSLSRRRLMAVSELAEEVGKGVGPKNSADLLTVLAGHLLEHMAPALEDLGDAVDAQEEKAVTESPSELQADLAGLRRQVISLRRHLAPQREAMVQLAQCTASQFDEDHRAVLQHLADHVVRYVEDLDELRDRTAVTHDLLAGRQADSMNRRMLMLSLVAAIFLPLGLITGLLGINVGGIPGAANEWAFLVVCALIVLLAGLQLFIMRKMKWF
ncbi:MAG: zinc transporter [Chlamydiales bacterium]|jgi:zinc transporter